MTTDVSTLLTQAQSYLKLTKISYEQWRTYVQQGRYNPTDGSGTNWGKALALIEQARIASQPTPPPPAPGVNFSGTALVRYSGTEGPQSKLLLYDYLDLAPWRLDDLAYAKENAPATQKVLAYQDATSSSSESNPASMTSNTPVSLEEAMAHDNANPNDQWVVRDSAGQPIWDRNYPGDRFMNLGSASYRARAQSHILAMLASPPKHWDGVMMDNTNPDWTYRQSAPGYVNGVLLTNALWRQNMITFASTVLKAIKAAGYYVMVNGGATSDNAGNTTAAWYPDIAPYINGVIQEYYQQAPTSGREMFYNDPSDWKGYFNQWLQIHDTANNSGIEFFGGATPVSSSEPQASQLLKAVYLKAAWLLKWNGKGGAAFWRGIPDPWDPSWTTPIGSPSGAMYAVGAGWRRDYTEGTVIINPNKPGGASITFPLGANYKKTDGTLTNSVILTPVTAMILTKSGA